MSTATELAAAQRDPLGSALKQLERIPATISEAPVGIVAVVQAELEFVAAGIAVGAERVAAVHELLDKLRLPAGSPEASLRLGVLNALAGVNGL